MSLHIRRAGPLDTSAMAELLNAIIRTGGSTAFTEEITSAELRDWMARAPGRSAWHIAEDAAGQVLGFQYIEPQDKLPADCCSIATFAREGMTGRGIGSALFTATVEAARALGYARIDATIRADNTGGRAYYQSRGFEQIAVERGTRLGDGTVVDRVVTRYRLD